MVDVPHANVVAILTRAPSAGGKTRLFTELGVGPDPPLLRALLLDTVENAGDSRYERIIAVTPASACDEVARLVPGIRVIPQVEGDLGARMSETLRASLAGGARRVALIGSDLPDIDPECIAKAFTLLTRDPASLVIGPSFDGGYYLIAATHAPPVFEGVEWGSSSVLAQTCALAARAGLTVHLLPEGGDVDTVQDLDRAVRSGRAPLTAARVRQIQRD